MKKLILFIAILLSGCSAHDIALSIDNAREADMLFDKLMGDKVEPRREFIEEHAEYVKNIDI